jgi:signal transduction histidine kinase
MVGIQQNVYAGDNKADSLRSLIKELPEGPEKADQLVVLSKHFYRIDYDSGMFYSNLAIKIAQRYEYLSAQADGLYIQSLIYKNRSDFGKAQRSLDGFIELCTKMDDPVRLAKGYHVQGSLYESTGSFELAHLYFKKSLATYLPLRDTHAIVANYNSIANYFNGVSKYDSAAFYYLRGIHLTELQKDELKLAILFRNLGNTYLEWGQYDVAKDYYNQALTIDRSYPNRERYIAYDYNSMARVAVEEGNYQDALNFYKQAEDYFTRANYQRGRIDVENNYGDLYFRKKDFTKAIQFFDRALTQYKDLGYTNEYVMALRNKAAAYTELGRYSQAHRLLDSCLRLAIRVGNRELRMNLLWNKAITYEGMGDFERANEFYKLHYNLKDSLFDMSKTLLINDLLLKYEKEKDQAQITLLENESLKKDIALQKRTRQRNNYVYGGGGITLLLLLLIVFYHQQSRKNKIITEQKIRRLEEEKKLLAARSIVEGQEEERKRIAEELHDGLGVLLSSAKMHFTTLKVNIPENKALIDKATKLIDEATGDVRRISHNMMPGILTRFGLLEAIQDLIEQVDDMEGIHAEVNIHGEERRLKENTEIMLYRVIQEMVNNTLKHAEAKNIRLEIELHAERMTVDYKDDGKGFDAEEKIKAKSIGLTSIQSRVKFLGGDLTIHSMPGTGVNYSFEVFI